LAPVPNFIGKGTPSLAAFPKPVKDFHNRGLRKKESPIFAEARDTGSCIGPRKPLEREAGGPLSGIEG
jgi:hypothetical protein